MYRVSVPCLSLWERWPSAARTERANKKGCKALSVTCGDSSPKGRAQRVDKLVLSFRGAPQGYLFRFAPLRGRPPLRTVYRRSFRRGRCPHRPVCHGSAAASSLPCVKAAQCSHWVVRRSVAEVSRRSRDGGRDTDAPHPLYPSVGAGFYPSCRYCITFRAGQSPAPTPVYRVCATPRSGVIARPVRRLVVAIRPRAPARNTPFIFRQVRMFPLTKNYPPR